MSNIIATLPKVDLCCDFTASLDPGWLRDKLGKKATKLDSWRAYSSPAEFRDSLAKLRGVLTKPGDWEEASITVFQRLIERATVHAEFHLDPLAKKVTIAEQVERIDAGHEYVTDEDEDALVSYGYVLELDRSADPGALAEAIDAACETSDRVRAVAFVGAEKKLTTKQRELAEIARKNQLSVVLSAGLEAGSKALVDCVELKPDRILHGFGLLKKEALLTQVRARRTPILCTPTVEVRTGRAKSMARHPIRKMLDAGLFCTFSSGAPLLINGSLTSEFDALSVHLTWRLDTLRNATLRAIEAAFIDPKLRFVVARAVENWRHRPRLSAGSEDDSFGM